jgi:PIN domain nuclease of toxin-antitoxin system
VNLHDAKPHLWRDLDQALAPEEVVIAKKACRARADVQVYPSALRMGQLRERFQELPSRAEHLCAVQQLPGIHRDPFDRLLVAYALQERLTLLSTERTLLA